MNNARRLLFAGTALLIVLGGCETYDRLQNQFLMSFFVTSKGSGKGADFGGLAGADGHCQALATAVGAGKRTWRAYLSTNASGSAPTQHARERIGTGPWQNAKGVVIARNVEELHGNNNLNKQTALTEKGEIVNGSGDTPNMHDILTGSQSNGMAFGGSGGPDLPQLDEQRRRRRDGRPPRPHGPARRRRLEVVELLASHARLQRGGAARDRRRGPALLLRCQLATGKGRLRLSAPRCPPSSSGRQARRCRRSAS